MLNLVLVSSSTIVSRKFEISNAEIMREIVGDVIMMRQVLILDGERVLFETIRGVDKENWRVAEIRDILKNGIVKRYLNENEIKALNSVRYRA